LEEGNKNAMSHNCIGIHFSEDLPLAGFAGDFLRKFAKVRIPEFLILRIYAPKRPFSSQN